jgi:predicted nuclease of predicted toxin-antitoxin system
LTFILDNNLSRKLADGMRAFGEAVEHLQDHLAQDIEDTVLLKYVGDKGLILVSRDLNIRRKTAELAALKQNKVGAFFLGGKNPPASGQRRPDLVVPEHLLPGSKSAEPLACVTICKDQYIRHDPDKG